jgi:hypoxanthine-DNA glycosylase
VKKISFPPVVSSACTKLILGSMPGEKSLSKQQYYAHGNNRFWKLTTTLLGGNVLSSYEERLQTLLTNNIALWDVLRHCEREGSSDINIKAEEANDFAAFFKNYPNIKTIFFNGSPPFDFYKQYVGFTEDKKFFRLPSTSGLNSWSTMEDLQKEWAVILK